MNPNVPQGFEMCERAGTASRSLLIGTLLVASGVLCAVVYFVGTGSGNPKQSAESSRAQGTESTAESKESPVDRADSTSDASPAVPPLRVKKKAPGTYRFELSLSLPGSVPASSSVSIALYRGNTEIDSGWEVMPDEQKRLEWATRKGAPHRRLPPGVYRVMLTISGGVRDVPERIDRYVSTNKKNTFQERVQSGEAWIYEVGVRVGSWEEIRAFERRHVRRLKRQGIELIDTWSDWRNDVRSAYKRFKTGKTVPPSIAEQFLSRLKTIRKRSERFLNQSDRNVRYLWTPDPEFKRSLRSFARSAPIKMASLTVTMLEQLIGGLPSDWPRKYDVSGFQSNIDVYDHMNQYHKRKVAPLRKNVTNWQGTDEQFSHAGSYRLFRLRRIVDIPEALRELASGSRGVLLRENLSTDTDLRQAILQALVDYARSLLAFHVDAYRDTIRSMEKMPLKRDPEQLLRIVRTALMTFCRDIYREAGVRIPDSMSVANASKKEEAQHLKAYRTLRESLSSSGSEPR